LIGKPVQAFVKAVSAGGASGLDVPIALAERVEAELVGDFGRVHRLWKILLIGEDEENSFPEFVLVQHAVQLFLGLTNSLPIVAVDDEDQPLRVLEVVPPEGSDLVLATDVPDGEGNVFVLDGFNVEADGRNGGDDLAEFKLVEDRGFPGRVQPDHQDAHLLLPEQTLKEAAKVKTHFLSFFRFFFILVIFDSGFCILISARRPIAGMIYIILLMNGLIFLCLTQNFWKFVFERI